MKNKGKHTLPRDCSAENELAHGVFDPMALMATVARQEAKWSTGDTLLRAGQTLYSPSDICAKKLKRTRPDGITEEGTFSGGYFTRTSDALAQAAVKKSGEDINCNSI